ncbi:hypothetical protein M409DRAFT_20563 [Zasmidium cellare ATCC 36951]|uniref:Methyltransferase domain-containing protein n=1 Tax=Zasmidium cellare ATCC 36951 TaxID=1080233 RepID=A0A6A6CT54_ZASCE|nr:uncharacterized protein M409DRAFT_20563 [Zasmidium cellare ATCC 36951]KAF2169340.1 hypothetical protein M409DRAFT_20563 [Zasmidium cellare ATCC 36951]
MADEGPYRELLPSNVSTEFDRLDQQTRALTSMMGGHNFVTDISSLAARGDDTSPFQAIEVGAGTGLRTAVLARQIAPSDANAKIYGVDLSPIPALHEQPPTVSFVQGNIMDLATGPSARFPPATFDFLTSRMLGVAITDWPAYLRTSFDLLKPGGRIELQEACFGWYDASSAELSQDWRWMHVMRKAGPKLGLDFWGPRKFPAQLRECGFVDVEVRTFKWLISPEDDEEIARYTANVLHPTFVGLLGRVVETSGLGLGELEGLGGVEGVKGDYLETVGRAPKETYCDFWVVMARKP